MTTTHTETHRALARRIYTETTTGDPIGQIAAALAAHDFALRLRVADLEARERAGAEAFRELQSRHASLHAVCGFSDADRFATRLDREIAAREAAEALVAELREACTLAANSDDNIKQATDQNLRDALADKGAPDEVKRGATAVLALRAALAKTPADMQDALSLARAEAEHANQQHTAIAAELEIARKDALVAVNAAADLSAELARLREVVGVRGDCATGESDYTHWGTLCDAYDEAKRLRVRVSKLEAKIEADAWKVSPAMAQAKIDQLNARAAELDGWKKQQLEVESRWDVQAVGNLLCLQPGTSIRPQIAPGIIALKARVAELEARVNAEMERGAHWCKEQIAQRKRAERLAAALRPIAEMALQWEIGWRERPDVKCNWIRVRHVLAAEAALADSPAQATQVIASGKIIRAGTMQVSGEEVTGIVIAIEREELRALPVLPLYVPANVTFSPR